MGIEIVVVDHHTARESEMHGLENVRMPAAEDNGGFIELVREYLRHSYGLVLGDQDHDGAMAAAIYALSRDEPQNIKCMRGDLDTEQLQAYEAEGITRILAQSRSVKHIETFLGICYGKAKTTVKRGIIRQVTGQNFWYMISGDDKLYIEIVEPLGHKAKQLNDGFNEKRAQLSNKFTKQFISDYCNKNGLILWEKVVKFNSGNITPEDREDLI